MATYFVKAAEGTPGSGTSRTIWAATTSYAVGDIVAPTPGYGLASARAYVYECTTAGTSGSTEPSWVHTTPDTSTTTSGTAVFTCRNPDTWAKAGLYLDQGLRRANTAGDIVVIDKNNVPSVDKEITADRTYSLLASIRVISGIPQGSSGWTYAPMGTDTWIGNSTTAYNVSFSGSYRVLFAGLTLRVSGTSTKYMYLRNDSGGGEFIWQDVYCWLVNTSSTSRIVLSSPVSTNSGSVICVNATFHFGNNGQQIAVGGYYTEIIGGTVTGTIPSTLFLQTSYRGTLRVLGMDLSAVSGTLISPTTSGGLEAFFDRCRLHSSVTISAAGASYSRGSLIITVVDCSAGDTHYAFGYYDYLGSLVVSTSVYANDGASYDGTNRYSWQVSTTAQANRAVPFCTPLIGMYRTPGAITPYIEVLRTDSTEKYKDDQLWIEVQAKTTDGSTLATQYSDKCALDGTPEDQPEGIGVSNWTGANSTSASMRLGLNSAINIAEIGELSARICFAVGSKTIYIDPQIRA